MTAQVHDMSDRRSIVPPHDAGAESAVLASVLCAPDSYAHLLRQLDAHHFFIEGNRRLWRAMQAVSASGHLDVVMLRGWLDDHRQLDSVGGMRRVLELLQDVPAVANVDDYVMRVRDKAASRHAIDACHQLAAAGYSATDAAAYLAQVKATITQVVDGAQTTGFAMMSAADIFAPLDPVRWAVPGLKLGPGRVNLVAGYGYSGKTIIAQDLALSVAAGIPAWSEYSVRQGIAVHIDYEQGPRGTARRYQRLAYGRGLSPSDLEDRLQLASMPRTYLTSPEAEDALSRACDGATLAIIDSLRASTPDVDENESQVARYLHLLTRVSIATECTIVLIHHAGKGHAERDAREVPRGSAGIYDACGTILTLRPLETSRTRIEVTKVSVEASGATVDPFEVVISDVADEDTGYGYAGVRVDVEAVRSETPAAKLEAVADRLLDELRACPDGVTSRYLQARSGTRYSTTAAALEHLERTGRAVSQRRPGRGGGSTWFLADLLPGDRDGSVSVSVPPLRGGERETEQNHQSPAVAGKQKETEGNGKQNERVPCVTPSTPLT